MQRQTFKATRKAVEELGGQSTGRNEYRVLRAIRLVERFLASDKW